MPGMTHGIPDIFREQQAWFGETHRPQITSGGAPVASGTLTLASFATSGYVRLASGELAYIVQTSAPIGPLPAVDGLYWLALHMDTTTVIGGWTRQAGTRYLWQVGASQPTTPANSLLFAVVTVAGLVTTAVRRLVGMEAAKYPSVVDSRSFGILGDDSDEGAKIQDFLYAAAGQVAWFAQPQVRFKTTQTLLIPDNTVVTGVWPVITQATANQSIFNPGNDVEICRLNLTGTGAFSVPGRAAIDGDPAATGTTGARVRIHDCQFSGLSTTAISGDNCIDWWIWSNDLVLGSTGEHGIYLSGGSKRCHVLGNHLRKTASGGISSRAINLKGTQDMWIVGNYITGVGWDGYGIVTEFPDNLNIWILDNDIDTLGAGAVGILLGATNSVDLRVRVRGNQIKDCLTGISNLIGFVQIEGNTIRSTTGPAILSDGTTKDTSFTSITSNKCYGCASGIRVVFADQGLEVKNNTVYGDTTGVGVAVEGGSPEGIVSGNISFNNATNYNIATGIGQNNNLGVLNAVEAGYTRYDLSGNATFTARSGVVLRAINLHGSNRVLDPTGTFPTGHTVEVINADGANTLTFNSTGLATVIAATGQASFTFNGTTWEKNRNGVIG